MKYAARMLTKLLHIWLLNSININKQLKKKNIYK